MLVIKKNGEGCANLGLLYKFGNCVKKDQKKALYYFEKSCKYGFGAGCFASAYYYEQGIEVKKETKKAIKLYKKACKLGLEKACNKIKKRK